MSHLPYPFRYKTDNYATHQPVLVELMKITSGPILELGSGFGSSHLLKYLISEDREVYSVESDKEWLARMREIEGSNYKMFHIDASNDDNDETGNKWVDFCEKNFSDISFDIVFVDQSPWTARTHTINYFLNRAKYVVVHDADYFPANNKWGKVVEIVANTPTHLVYKCDFSDIATHSYLYYPPAEYFPMNTGPPTLVLSNFVKTQEFKNFLSMLEKSKAIYYQ